MTTYIYPKKELSPDLVDAGKDLRKILLYKPNRLNRKNATQGKNANSFIVGNVSFYFVFFFFSFLELYFIIILIVVLILFYFIFIFVFIFIFIFDILM